MSRVPLRARRRTVATLLALAAGPCVALPEDGERFRDWVARCETTAGGERRCVVSQQLVRKRDGRRVLSFSVSYTPPRPEPVALVTLPLGIALPPGIDVRVDGGKMHHFGIERCIATGCQSGFVLDAELLPALRRGLVAEITLRDASRKPVTLSVSLAGFTAALRSLR